MFVELDLDATKYTRAQKAILAGAQQNSADINKVFKTVGTQTDEMYDAMRKNVENALNAIKKSHLTSADEIRRAQESAAQKINQINEQQFGKQTSMLENVKQHWMGLTAIATGAYLAIEKFAGEPIRLYMAHEQALLKMGIAMKNQGDYTRESLKWMVEYADELQRVTAESNDAILSVMGGLKSYGMSNQEVIKATKVSMDFASAKRSEGMSVTTAAELIGKAYAGQTQTLTRYGIVIDQTLSASEKFDAVMKQLQERFGGSAQAELLTYEGQWKNLKNQWDDIQKVLGITFLKTIDAVKLAWNFLGQSINEIITGILQGLTWLSGAIGKFARAMGLTEMAKSIDKVTASLQSMTDVSQGAVDISKANADANIRMMVTTDGVSEAIDKVGISGKRTQTAIEEARRKEEAELKALLDAWLDYEAKHTTGIEESLIEAEDLWKAYFERIAKAEAAEANAWAERGKLAHEILAEEMGYADDYRKVSIDAENAVTKAAQDEYDKRLKQYQHLMERIHDATANVFEEIYSGQIRNWQDFLDILKDYFIRFLAELSAAALTEKIIVPIVADITGISDLLDIGAGKSGGLGGITNIASLASKVPGMDKIIGWARGLFGGGSLSGAAPTAGADIFASAAGYGGEGATSSLLSTLGGVGQFGALAAAGWAGLNVVKRIGDMIFGNKDYTPEQIARDDAERIKRLAAETGPDVSSMRGLWETVMAPSGTDEAGNLITRRGSTEEQYYQIISGHLDELEPLLARTTDDMAAITRFADMYIADPNRLNTTVTWAFDQFDNIVHGFDDLKSSQFFAVLPQETKDAFAKVYSYISDPLYQITDNVDLASQSLQEFNAAIAVVRQGVLDTMRAQMGLAQYATGYNQQAAVAGYVGARYNLSAGTFNATSVQAMIDYAADPAHATDLYRLAQSLGISTSDLISDLQLLGQAFLGTSNDVQAATDRITSSWASVSESVNWAVAQAHGTSRSSYLASQIMGLPAQWAGGYDMTDIEHAASLIGEWYQAAVSEAIDNANKMAQSLQQSADAAKSLADTIGQTIESLRFGALNIALPSAKFAIAQQQYAALSAAAFGGDQAAAQKLAQFAPEFLQMAQEVYKSSGAYQQIYESTLSDLGRLQTDLASQSDSLQAQANDYLSSIDSTLAGIDSTLQQVVAALQTYYTALTGAKKTTTPTSVISGISDADVAAFVQQNFQNPSAVISAMNRYGVTPDQLVAAINAGAGTTFTVADYQAWAAGAPMAQAGGIFSGPLSGYPVMLHGTEAVVPVSPGSGGGSSRSSQVVIQKVIIEMDGKQFDARIKYVSDATRVRADNAGFTGTGRKLLY
jgi:hypothetical protein